MMKRIIVCFILASFLLSFFSCTKTQPADVAEEQEQEQEGETPAPEVQYPFLAAEAPSSLPAEERGMVSDIQSFACSFLARIAEVAQGSFVVSPTSLAYLLGMLSEGAAGQTREEIISALGFDGKKQEGIGPFCRDLMVLTSSLAPSDAVVEVANGIWPRQGHPLSEPFRKALRNYYDASFQEVDFSKTDEALARINGWASDKTHGSIEKLMDVVDPSAPAVFANALYFKAEWKCPFSAKKTEETTFHLDDNRERKVQMMKLHHPVEMFQFFESEDLSMLTLPFGENGCSMSFLLPAQDKSLADLLAQLDGRKLSSVFAGRKWEHVDIWIPKMTVDSKKDLSGTLSKMGIRTLFEAPDLSPMWEKAGDGNSSVRILQSSTLSLDEKGAEAASATFTGSVVLPPEVSPVFKEFHADRPFVFLIQENKTGALLFAGCYR